MADGDKEVDVPHLRKVLKRCYNKLQKQHTRFTRILEEDSPATTDFYLLEEALKAMEDLKESYDLDSEDLAKEEHDEGLAAADERDTETFQEMMFATKFTIRLLLSKRAIHRAMTALDTAIDDLNAAFMAQPTKDHSHRLKDLLGKESTLEKEISTTTLRDDDPLIIQSAAVRKKSYMVTAKLAKETVPDSKIPTTPAPGKSVFKLSALNVPSFSGRTEDWLPFWRRFKMAVHDKPDLDDPIRLSYLLDSLEDTVMRDSFSERMEEIGAYQTILKELQAKFDKPRWMHHRYWGMMKGLTTIPHTREAMNALLVKVDTIYKGFLRLKKSDVQHILTSAVEEVMSTELRSLWDQRTDTVKDVPPIEDLVTFIKSQADRLEEVRIPDTPQTPRQQTERAYRPARQRQRGHTNTTTSSSAAANNQLDSSISQTPRTAPRYGCPLCSDNHYPYQCSKFNQFSLAQRKTHVQENELCVLCLKPWHTASNCTSTYKCRFCRGNHNSLLHQDNTPAGQGASHSTASTGPTPRKDHLMMTSHVILTGPTGTSTVARALLDSGSTLSILSTKVMKTLALKKSRQQTYITGVGATPSSAAPCSMAKVNLSSDYQHWSKDITVAVMDKVTSDIPLQGAAAARDLPHLKNLHLADKDFYLPGTIDILLGQDVFGELLLNENRKGPPETPMAWLTVFGWAIMGPYTPDNAINRQSSANHSMITTTAPSSKETEPLSTDEILAQLMEIEEPQEKDRLLTPEERMVEDHFERTHSYDKEERRYTVRLPMKGNILQLGDSKGQAINRAKANNKSLKRRGCWTPYQEVMQKYVDTGHAILLTPEEVAQLITAYYMPVHAVFKQSSSTTKVRAVFDASAKTTTQVSLNELMAVGPTLQPTLDQTLLRFRTYPVALSGDISQMYREVLLHPEDRHLHRFIWRPDDDQPWQEYQMTRVTFGVAASPYLAVKVLLQAAKDFAGSLPNAKFHLETSFYVDDFMGGAATTEEAITLYHDLRAVLEQAGFHLKKWRSSSTEVLQEIPEELQEPLPQQEMIDQHGANYPRALGIVWDSREDTLATYVSLPPECISTKRGVISDVARTFDVLGWICPAILPMKILYRELWALKMDWDDKVPDWVKEKHQQWRNELFALAAVRIPRHYFNLLTPTKIELHGFCDASQDAYAACIYIRATYSNSSPTSLLVTAKTRVAPLKTRTIPQLELCGAYLLARLMSTVRQTLCVEPDDCYAYCDSTIVLAWLNGSPQLYKVFVANRIVNTTTLIPAAAWHHVPTTENPADCASRGLTAEELKAHHLWWTGPSWLLQHPVPLPPQPTAASLEQLQGTEAKPEVCHVITHAVEILEAKFSSFSTLVRVMCWVKRFTSLTRKNTASKDQLLSRVEIQEAEAHLRKRSQERSFHKELDLLKATPPKPIPARSFLVPLHPFLDQKSLLRLGGRLQRSSFPTAQKHPVILSASDLFTKKLFLHYHLQLGHCGPSTLLAHSGNLYYVMGARRLARTICSQCVVCRKAAVRAGPQLMGQLPPARVEPNMVFFHSGLDFAGPYTIRVSHTRHPVFIKGYLAIFICFCTKAVHLELVKDQSTEAFVAALERFISRRGLPFHIHSDNGLNFIGAKNELHVLYQMFQKKETQNLIHSYLLSQQVQWHTSPERAPHFGGLWEAAVKSAKYHIKRLIGQQRFTYEELLTVFCKVESYLNSRPLGPVTSHSTDGVTPLTPGHFIIGRALRAYPTEKIDFNPTTLQRWVLCQKITQQFWKRWSAEYLQHLQRAVKWHRKTRNFCVGDLVMMTDGNVYQAQWTMAKIITVYKGQDGLVRAADVQVETAVLPTGAKNKKQLMEQIKTKTATYRRPITKLSLLLAADETPQLEQQ